MSEVRDEIMNLLVNLEKQGDIKTLYPSNVIPALVGYIAQREARAATAARIDELEACHAEAFRLDDLGMWEWTRLRLAVLNTKPVEQNHCLLCGMAGHTREQCQAEVTLSPKPVEREDV